MNDFELVKDLRKGDRRGQVKLIQEWLCLHGIYVIVDGIFGDATASAVSRFQSRKGLDVPQRAVVDEKTFNYLTYPMTKALDPITTGVRTLNDLIIAYAYQHLEQNPHEVGGQNRGPWIRLYMNGRQGFNYPWCAGFVFFILKCAYSALDLKLPFRSTVSCDILARRAAKKKMFHWGEDIEYETTMIKKGSLFLCRKTRSDWTHVGFVTGAATNIFNTIEGNTNDEGSREGYELCERIRGYKNKDFIIL